MGVDLDQRSTTIDAEHRTYASELHTFLTRAMGPLIAPVATALPLYACLLVYPDRDGYCRCIQWQDGTVHPNPDCATLPLLDTRHPALDGAWGQTLLDAEARRLPGCPLALIHLREEELLGMLVVAKPVGSPPWTDAERALFQPGAELLVLTLSCQAQLESSTFQNWLYNKLMDNMQAGIYITDVETDEIIFMNRHMKQVFGVEAPEGKLCWQLLQQNMAHRCDFCPVPMLMQEDSPHPTCIWEEQNTQNGHIYENHDSLMRWPDGRVVHVQQSLDITETKRLYIAATVDELTGLLNRRAGREVLQGLIDRCRADHVPIAVCSFDINELKDINTRLGHRIGDMVLTAVGRAASGVLEENDCLFRAGGDEFVLGFYNTTLSAATKRMGRAQATLDSTPSIPGVERIPAFSYGLLELPHTHCLDLQDVLSAVDEKLYEQKRFHHIRLAQERLSFLPEEDAAVFDYESALLYDALIQSTDDYLYVSNMKTGTFRYPPAMVEEFGLPGQVVPNAAAIWGAKVHPADQAAFLASNQEIMDGRTDCHCVEYRARNHKGEWVWLRCRGHVQYDEHGQAALFAGFITNLGKRSRIDHLTGLLNKTEFESELADLLERDSSQPLAVLIFGIDDLKHINSLYDRSFGDEVIRIAAQKLQSMLPQSAYLYRLDGDEFGVLLRDGTEHSGRALYHRVQAAFGHQHSFDGTRFYCTLSCGCATAPQDGNTAQALVKYAHFALDHAKQQGKNQICFFSPELLHHLERRLELTELLREAVEDGFRGFEMYYQPIFTDLGTRLTGAEALCRWRCEKYGPISPVEFIPLLEQSGLILQVGRWIFQQALETGSRWQLQAPGFIMGVNLSNLQLEDPTFIEFLEVTIADSGIIPSRLVVELTETYLASNVTHLKTYLVRLRSLGVLIAMDDFGTGYSALGILKEYPIDIVKLDRIFVKDIHTNAFDSAFIQFVVDLCHRLNISSCLEGVETQRELDTVSPFAPDYFQGFYFSRPIPKSEFEARYLA